MSAITLRCGEASVTVLPVFGARISSLTVGAKEWIAQPLTPPQSEVVGAPFVRPAIGGWDEMLPTISGEPDHGEVWTREWDVDSVDECSITTTVALQTAPLTLMRAVRLDTDRLTLDYQLTCSSASDVPVPVLWAAHPLLQACEVRLPAHVTGVLDVMPDLVPTRRPQWVPLAEASLHHDQLAEGGWAKYYVPFGVPITGVVIADREGRQLRWSWSAEAAFLGIWIDRSCFGPGDVVAPEPALAAWDDVTVADAMHMAPRLHPGERRSWTVEVGWDVEGGPSGV